MKFSTQILNAAWAIVRATAAKWGDALRQAIAGAKVKLALAALKIGQVARLEYRKADGTLRVAFAVPFPFPTDFQVKGTGNAIYFDRFAGVGGEVRSFSLSRLVSFTVQNA